MRYLADVLQNNTVK